MARAATLGSTGTVWLGGGLGGLLAAAFAGSLGGCGGQGLNARPVLGGTVTIAALREHSPSLLPEPVVLKDDEPSLRTTSRAEWAAQRFEVPVDGTVHSPIRRWGLTPAGGNPRRSGLWPTLESSLRVSDGPGRALTVEAWTAWIEALGEVVCLPYDLVMAPGLGKRGRRASPWAMYKRYPESGEWTSVSAAQARPPRGKRSEIADQPTTDQPTTSQPTPEQKAEE
ncbi:MAG: hypothetical protein ACI89L_002697 [Phycisphaerales bacterium]|jgi:hypothetical protein